MGGAARFRAWQERVAEWLPPALFRPGLPEAAAPVAALPEGLPLDLAFAQAIAAQRLPARATLTLHLPLSAALERSLHLPPLSPRQAAAAIDLRLRQTLPHQGAGLAWQSQALPREGGQQRHRIYLVKEEDLALLRQKATEAGLRLREIRLQGLSGPPLWPAPAAARAGAVRPWAEAALRRGLFVAALGVLALGFLLYWQVQDAAARLEAENAATLRRIALYERALTTAAGSAEAAAATRQTQARDLASFARNAGRLGLLAELTQTLPDGVWLSEIVIGEAEMRLAGFTKDEATLLVETLQAAPWASAVRLDGPVLLDPISQQNRVNLWIGLAAPEGPSP